MHILKQTFLALIALSVSGLSSCSKNDPEPEPEPEVSAADEAHRKMKEQLAELENEVHEFREGIANSMNQQAIDRMSPEELEALRESGVELPDSVELPPEE